MSDATDIGTLQSAADYATVRRSVKTFGVVALVFGAVHMMRGVNEPADYALVGFGGLLFGAGLYNVATPRPIGLALAGGLLVLVGILDTVDSITASAAGGGATTWVTIGVLQIIWGGNGFMRFRRFRSSFSTTPPDQMVEYAQEMLKDLKKAKPGEETDVLEFVSGRGLRSKPVRVRLMPESALCLVGGGTDVLVVPPDQIEIEDSGKAMIGQNRKVKLSVGQHEFKGNMSPEFIERFRTWKLGSALAHAA
jgi:hypothetical protein